jgi:hypothetical protein
MFIVAYNIGYQKFVLQVSGGYAGGEQGKANPARFATMKEAGEFAILFNGFVGFGG